MTKTKLDTKLLRRLLKYLAPYKWKFILAFFMMFITTFTGMILPLVSGLAVDIMKDPTIALIDKSRIIMWGAIILIAIMGISIVIGYFQNMMLQKIGQKVTHEIRLEVFSHIETLSTGQINDIPIGKLVTRATNDPGNISEMFTNTIVNLVRNFMMMLVVGIILFVINPLMALVTLAVLPLIVIATRIFQKYSRTSYRTVRNHISDMNAFLSENLSGIKVTQVFNQEAKKLEEFDTINNKLRKGYLREINAFAVYRPLIYFLSSLATVIAVYFGVKSVLTGAITAGLFISFYIYIGQFYEPIQQMADQFNALQNGFASAEKVFEILDMVPSVSDNADAIELTDFKGEIEFRDVWFQYIPDEWVLKGVSFAVKPNETVAFVGATGSGKTTILQLIVRNYDIQKGEILIDGINIRNITRASLRRYVGQMMQDVFLFSGTIRDNVTLGNESISDDDIRMASNYVGLDYVLNKVDGGINHVVKERGHNFSSGERQLISFARAVLYKPRLMILDEATANIDAETESIIQESLSKMMNISTMIIVAHRLSTIQHSDKIFVMHKGEIKEQGNHQTLLKAKGLYYNLYKLQYDPKLQS